MSWYRFKPNYNDVRGVYGLNTAADGATVTFDTSLAKEHAVTLGGNRTFVFANTQVGDSFSITVKQDATGSRTVTWPSGIKWAGGGADPHDHGEQVRRGHLPRDRGRRLPRHRLPELLKGSHPWPATPTTPGTARWPPASRCPRPCRTAATTPRCPARGPVRRGQPAVAADAAVVPRLAPGRRLQGPHAPPVTKRDDRAQARPEGRRPARPPPPRVAGAPAPLEVPGRLAGGRRAVHARGLHDRPDGPGRRREQLRPGTTTGSTRRRRSRTRSATARSSTATWCPTSGRWATTAKTFM